jgi:hypothetical protein
MKWVPLAGGFLLLACMVFAVVKLESADQWVRVWLPFVAAGVLPAFFGAVAGRRRSGMEIWRNPTPSADA